MARLRVWLSRIVCFWLGHLIVSRDAIWKMERDFIDARVEAVCLRCGRQETFMADLVDNVFAESPVFKKTKRG